MSNVITVDFNQKKPGQIDLNTVKNSRRALSAGLIAPATEVVETNVVEDHKSDPIKSLEDIHRMSDWFIQNGKYRDNMLFIVGINFGLRISDLLKLRFSHLLDDHFCFRLTFPILEQKTSKTRKVAKNRYITINEAVMDAVTLYLEHTPGVTLSDYLFKNESSNSDGSNKPMHRYSVERTLKEAAKAVGLECHVATHTLRKTFGYHQMMASGNDPRKLLLLQKIFGHASSAVTLDYIGITSEEIEDAYLSLNLGSKYNYLVSTNIREELIG